MKSEEKKAVEVCTPVGIQPGTKLLQLRYNSETKTWKLWLHHDRLMQYGTFLLLSAEGGVTRIVLRPDGTEEEHVVK